MIQTQLHFAKGGVKMSMPLSALPLVVPGLDKHVVRDGIPGVVNADEEQQQHRRCDAKQSLAQMGAPYADTANVTYAAKGNRTWNNQSSKLGLVRVLRSHSPSDDGGVRYAPQSHEPPKSCRDADPLAPNEHRRDCRDRHPCQNK